MKLSHSFFDFEYHPSWNEFDMQLNNVYKQPIRQIFALHHYYRLHPPEKYRLSKDHELPSDCSPKQILWLVTYVVSIQILNYQDQLCLIVMNK
jgi:hypothetical protein